MIFFPSFPITTASSTSQSTDFDSFGIIIASPSPSKQKAHIKTQKQVCGFKTCFLQVHGYSKLQKEVKAVKFIPASSSS